MDQQDQLTTLYKGFDALQEHVVITDEHGVILYANKAVERTTGFPLNEVIGKKPNELWGGKMQHSFYEHMWHTIRDEKNPFVGEVHNVRKDGTEYWQELHITPVLNEKGNIRYFIGIEPDITDRKKREEFREEFFSIARHQIMNPLTKNNIILNLLLNQPGMEKQKPYIEQLYMDNQGIMTLINDLIFLSRMENQSLSKQKIDLGQIIEETIKPIKSMHPRVTFSITKEGAEFSVTCNDMLTKQVFYNIIANAAEYSSQDTGMVIILVKDNGTYFTFSCRDNGIGIPADEQGKIFQKFYRASNASDAKSDGSGLGMYIIKTICDEFSWKYGFTSEVGKGTTVTLSIPKV